MSLLPLAQRLVTDAAKVRQGAVGTSPPIAAETPASEPAGPASAPSSDELNAMASEAQALLARAGENEAIRRDPYRFLIAGASVGIGMIPKIIHHYEAAAGALIAARHPLTPEERADLRHELSEATQDGAYQGMRKEAARMVRRLDRGLAVRIGLGVGGAFAGGCLFTLGLLAMLGAGPFRPDVEAGAAWRELVQNNPDPRQALTAGEVRTDRATGRRYHAGVSLWLDPPRAPPPAAGAKPQGNQ